jgi:hypothetical protein
LLLKLDVEHLDDYIALYRKLSPSPVNFTSRTRDGLVMPTPNRPVQSGKTPGIVAGKLPTYRFMTWNGAMMAAWLVVTLFT